MVLPLVRKPRTSRSSSANREFLGSGTSRRLALLCRSTWLGRAYSSRSSHIWVVLSIEDVLRDCGLPSQHGIATRTEQPASILGINHIAIESGASNEDEPANLPATGKVEAPVMGR
jgi:hypothetical protein